MSRKSYVLQSIAAIVSVTPQPQTLAHSYAVLRKLTSFGRIDTFKHFDKSPLVGEDKPNRKRPQVVLSLTNDYRVLFADAGELSNAINASPFTVDVDHDLPDPKEIDPYNLTGSHFRKKPVPASYLCTVVRDSDADAHLDLTSENPFHAGFKRIKDSVLYQSLLESQAPLGLIRGIDSVASDAKRLPTPDKTNYRKRLYATFRPSQFTDRSPILMGMYRNAVRRQKSQQDVATTRPISPATTS